MNDERLVRELAKSLRLYVHRTGSWEDYARSILHYIECIKNQADDARLTTTVVVSRALLESEPRAAAILAGAEARDRVQAEVMRLVEGE